jgi:hypothetical protein
MNCRPTKPRCCPPKIFGKASLRDLVRHYIKYFRAVARQELADFREEPSLQIAIDRAARAHDKRNKRFDHQRLIRRTSIARAPAAFRAAASTFQACKTFDELHDLVQRISRGVGWLGELYVYDTALRIGAYLELSPTEVYLHRGTRDGARNLGLNVSRQTIPMDEFAEELKVLTPDELENFLCIYKLNLSSK